MARKTHNLLNNFNFSPPKTWAPALALLLCGLCVPSPAGAQVETLSQNNSSVTLNLSSSAGMEAWDVNGVNEVSQQSYWFRVGSSGPQMPLSQITSTPTFSISGLHNQILTALYTNSSYGVQVQYDLAGQSVGSGNSGLTELVTVYNYSSSSPLAFNLFLYSDFTLQGNSSAQNVQLGTSTNGVSSSIQTYGASSNVFTVSGPAASYFEAAPNNTQTLNELNSSSGYTLNGTTTAGPGGVTWAMEWNTSIAANSSFSESFVDNLQNVPEPSTAALAVLGAGLGLLYRTRQRLTRS